MSYLDYAAGAPLRPQARAAMLAAWEQVGNPSSAHAAGRAAAKLLEEARESLAADIGAHPAEIVFTSGGTEANNLALRGLTSGRIAVSAVEHPSLANAVGSLPNCESIPVGPDGRVAPAHLPNTALVCVQMANSETGVIQPVAEIAAANPLTLVHSDAVQALGHLPICFAESGLAALTITAHKVGGPAGVGALVLRRGVPFSSPAFGGEQEARRRPGTVPAALACGFAAAVRAAVSDPREAQLRAMHDQLIDGAKALGARANCTPPCNPAIVNLTFPGVRAADLLLLLDRQGICCSAGSACHAGVARPSPVLLAMGAADAEASASLRFSFGWDSRAQEIGQLLAALPSALAEAQGAFTG